MKTARLLLGLALLCSSAASRAQLDLIFNPALVSARPGQTATFNATLINNTSGSVNFDGTSFTLSDAGLLLDDTKFFINFAGPLAPGGSITADIFDVMVASSVPLNDYAGTFNVKNGSTVVASGNFVVRVTPAPPAFLVAVSGILGTLIMRRRSASASSECASEPQ
jgi:hypothetical protein